jgi:hypothetical protein
MILGRKSLIVLGLAVALAIPARAAAEGIGFVNELKIPIIVQGSTVENNMVRRGLPVLVFPGKTGWDINLKLGRRFITIYDGRQTTRVLYQGPPLLFAGRDMLFAVRALPTTPPRVVLIPVPKPGN